MTIGEGESLTIPDGSSLTSGKLTNEANNGTVWELSDGTLTNQWPQDQETAAQPVTASDAQ